MSKSGEELPQVSVPDILVVVFTFSISTLPVPFRDEIASKSIPERQLGIVLTV